jgi:hypothetical protein
MIKSNIFYLFLVGIFLTLSALSFYWFNNVDSYTNTHSAKENLILESSANIWHKFNAILSFLDIFSDNSKNQTDYKDIDILDNPIEKSAGVLSTFEINDQLEQEDKKEQKKSSTASIGEIMEEKQVKEEKWYKDSSQWISKKGFYAFKKDNSLELGWQNSQGKTYSISIPY